MEENRKRRGLCCACKGEADCQHVRNGESPVLQCEEFEPCDCAPCSAPPRKAQRLQARDERLAGEDGAEPRGLCANCDNRENCDFPRPPGGVWHCTEYR